MSGETSVGYTLYPAISILNKYANKFVQCANRVMPQNTIISKGMVIFDGKKPQPGQQLAFELCDEAETVLQTVISSDLKNARRYSSS